MTRRNLSTTLLVGLLGGCQFFLDFRLNDEFGEQACHDTIDNDLDGTIDCEDDSCAEDLVCRGIVCGDGILQSPEEVCDDGNTSDGDGCRRDCRAIDTCGNGTADPDELCLQAHDETLVTKNGIQLVSGDLDGDGNLDLVAANAEDDTLSIFLGDGALGFAESSVALPSSGLQALALGELDGNPGIDLIATTNTSLVTFTNDFSNGGTFVLGTQLPANLFPKQILLVDLDQDGLDEIVVANGDPEAPSKTDTLQIFQNLTDGSFQLISTIDSSILSLSASDIDRDDDIDLVAIDLAVGTTDEILLVRNLENSFVPERVFASQNLSVVGIGDVDGDNNQDLLVSVTLDGVEGEVLNVLENNGNGGFDFNSSNPFLGVGTSTITAQDMNNDGTDDVAITSTDNDTLYFFVNQAGRLVLVSIQATLRPVSLQIGDFDNDGQQDVAVLSRSDESHEITILRGNR